MEDVTEQLAAAVAMSPLVVGLVEGAKQTGLPSRFAVLAALLAGEAVAFLFAAAGWANLTLSEPADAALVGLASGLMASGLYSGVKALASPAG